MGVVLGACSGRQAPVTEPVTELPDASQIRQEQGRITQDSSPDPRRDDEQGSDEAARVAATSADMRHVSQRTELMPPAGFVTLGTYVGTLPCADCAGIETELTLYNHPETGHRRYILRQTYLTTRQGDAVFWDGGAWMVHTIPGGRQIYRLSWNDDAHKRSFEVNSSRVLRQLDREEQPIDSEHNYALYRIPGN